MQQDLTKSLTLPMLVALGAAGMGLAGWFQEFVAEFSRPSTRASTGRGGIAFARPARGHAGLSIQDERSGRALGVGTRVGRPGD